MPDVDRIEIIYSDADGNLVEQSKATHAEAIEYDAGGNVIHRVYAEVNGEK